MTTINVLCCRAGRGAAEADHRVRVSLDRCRGRAVDFVGPRPGKEIDPLLSGRVVVLGDDADLAAVVLRLLRRELLGTVILGFATDRATAVTDLWSLPLGAAAVDLAVVGDPDPVPIVRDDVGGVVIGVSTLLPIRGIVYVDEFRVFAGTAAHLVIQPDTAKGLAVTVVPRRLLWLGRRPRTFRGRAVQIGTTPALVASDGKVFDRKMERWTCYRHTEPLRLVRGVLAH